VIHEIKRGEWTEKARGFRVHPGFANFKRLRKD
jgi:hypothetical protein